MRVHDLRDFVKGWFIGNFEPSLLKTDDFEVSVRSYRKGESESRHVHKVAREFTVVVSGVVAFNGCPMNAGSIIDVPAGEAVTFNCIEDAVTVVVKAPCVKGDKYEVDSTQG